MRMMEATKQTSSKSPSRQIEWAGNPFTKKSKIMEIAQNIAKVDDLLQAVYKKECHNLKLQQQLKDFQVTAQQVQQLYNNEKNYHSKAKNDLEQLQKEYNKIDVELTNMTMVNDQLKARLAEYDGRPVNFDNLVVKYVKIVNKLEGHDLLTHYTDKDLVERLREYCATKKLKIPKANTSPKKSRSRGNKPKTEEKVVQCNLLEENFSEKQICKCKTKNNFQDQTTQCTVEKRDQGSQYISTMITRQTNTEKLVQKHIQTMFPEPPAADDVHSILNIFNDWSNIRSVSPLRGSPTRTVSISQDMLKKYSTSGTCTMLCNIRRKIDYLPINNSSNIKQEVFTPSVSPTTVSYSMSRPSSHSNNLLANITSSSLLNLFNSTTNSSLEQLSPSAFCELWQIFGKMLLSLLQTNNAGSANSNQNIPLNQQQFLDWLLELYTSSQPQNTTTTETQTSEEIGSSVSRSPLCFNDASLLSTDVVKPQPHRIGQEESIAITNIREHENNMLINPNLIDNISNSQIPIADSSNNPEKINQHDCDLLMSEIHQKETISNTNELHGRNICEPNLHNLSKKIPLEKGEKSTKKTKFKDKILEQIQKLLLDGNLNKNKRKTLKRLLKNNNHRKKSFESRKSKTESHNKQSSGDVLGNDKCETVETAVDFLKSFAVTQNINQPLETKMSETEKLFLQKISSKNVPNNVSNNLISEERRDLKIPRLNTTESCQKMVNKYNLLFGESDSELGDQDVESYALNDKHVIKSTSKMENGHCKYNVSSPKSKINSNLISFNPVQDRTNQAELSNNTNFFVENNTNKILLNSPVKNTSYPESPSINIQKPTFNNSCDHIASQDPVAILDKPTSILRDLECSYLPDILYSENVEVTKYVSLDANKQDHNSISETNRSPFTNIGSSVENDLELSSDDCSAEEDDEGVIERPKLKKETATLKEIKYININNPIEQLTERTEIFKNQETILQGSADVTNIYKAENVIKSNSNLIATDTWDKFHRINSLPPFDGIDKSTCKNRIKLLPNLSENDSSKDSRQTHQILNKSPLTSSSSDIDKDLELSSSDDESYTSESDVNDIQEVSPQTFEESQHYVDNFNTFDNLQNSSTEQRTGNMELYQDANKLNEFKEDFFNNSPSNISNITDKTHSKNQTEMELSRNVSFVRSGKEEVSKTIKNSTNQNETGDDVVSFGKEDNYNTYFNCIKKPKKDMNINNGANILESDFEVYNLERMREEKKQIENFQPNRHNEFDLCNNFKNAIKSNQQLIELEHEKEQQNNQENENFGIRQKNEFVNKSKSEKTPLVWSVITISNAISRNETLNTKELIQKNIGKNEDKSVPKVSTLRTLKLLDLKKEPNHHEVSSNHSKYDSNRNKFVAHENNTNPLSDKEAAPANITKPGPEEKETILASSVLKTPNYIKGSNMGLENSLNEENKFCLSQMIAGRTLENCSLSNAETMPNNVLNSTDDSLSIENELVIDEELNNISTSKEFNGEHLNNSTSKEPEEKCNVTTSHCNISLLDSTIYSDISDDLLEEEDICTTSTTTPEVELKRGRKRKIECLSDLQPQHLKDKRMILEESFNLSNTTIELGKYTKGNKNSINNLRTKCPVNYDDMEQKCETSTKCELLENKNSLQLGFFKERVTEEDATININSKALIVTKSQKTKLNDNKILKMSSEAEKVQHIHEVKQQNQLFVETEDLNYTAAIANESEEKSCNREKDVVMESFEQFIYSHSPQSPVPSEPDNIEVSETRVIPLERPAQFVLQDNHLTLFDVLIKSYRIENHKQVLKSVSTTKCKRKEDIFNQFCKEIKSYCYSEMELDLFCTSARAINKLLSISPDYDLMQRALIKVAQHAEGTNTPEHEFPSIIQEMPPRHLSKCLQRLFVFLKTLTSRNATFCQDLIRNIESRLFNFKKTEPLSLQATLNLTQLFLMASKIQEHIQISKHPARLFIAKALYFYLQNAILMIHEVLLWFPTVLPHREDTTYDRSDALISVIQHILMSTKYEMTEKPHLRGKILLSKLRYEYHFEPFKPSTDEVIHVLMEKLKNSKFYNISLAFGLLCKRMGAPKIDILNIYLMPLANQYYSLALKTNEYDARIAVLLEVISMLVKLLPFKADTQKYFNEFSRFLNGFERQLIQEAALCSVLRLQRFNVKSCYDLIRHFQPAYNMKTHTETMLKTFLYRRPLEFWKNLQSQS